jgi:hypothetical protein
VHAPEDENAPAQLDDEMIVVNDDEDENETLESQVRRMDPAGIEQDLEVDDKHDDAKQREIDGSARLLRRSGRRISFHFQAAPPVGACAHPAALEPLVARESNDVVRSENMPGQERNTELEKVEEQLNSLRSTKSLIIGHDVSIWKRDNIDLGDDFDGWLLNMQDHEEQNGAGSKASKLEKLRQGGSLSVLPLTAVNLQQVYFPS